MFLFPRGAEFIIEAAFFFALLVWVFVLCKVNTVNPTDRGWLSFVVVVASTPTPNWVDYLAKNVPSLIENVHKI